MQIPPSIKTTLPRGFAGSFDDQVAGSLDLNALLISHPAATYFMRVDGDGLVSEGTDTGDILIVDRSLSPVNDDIVVAVVDGEFVVKQYHISETEKSLLSHYGESAITLNSDSEIALWGVVTATIRKYRR